MPIGKGKVTMKDLGIGKLKRDLARLAATRVTLGYQGPSGAQEHPSTPGVPVAQVAAFNEFGTEKAPARPLGQHTMAENQDAFTQATSKAVSDVVDGRKSVEDAEQDVGEVALAALRRTISRSREWAEANATSTKAAKGHDQPLVGEDQTLTTNASWAIRRGDGIVRQGGEE